jgi:hypothetical protein
VRISNHGGTEGTEKTARERLQRGVSSLLRVFVTFVVEKQRGRSVGSYIRNGDLRSGLVHFDRLSAGGVSLRLAQASRDPRTTGS